MSLEIRHVNSGANNYILRATDHAQNLTADGHACHEHTYEPTKREWGDGQC